jgi:glyoxalase family protein
MVHRFVSGDGGPGTIVDVRAVGGFLKGMGGAGTVHHVAFRVPDDGAELALRERVAAAGLQPTLVMDRAYFHSVYFREPGGVLFEIATDVPGFLVDETPETLGSALQLPPQYASVRRSLESQLPELRVPGASPHPYADAE